MKFKRVLWGLGSILKFFSIPLLVPLLPALSMDDRVALRTYSLAGAELQVPETVIIFLLVALATAFLGLLLEALGEEEEDLREREGYAIVAIGWLLLAFVGTFPFWLSGTANFLDSFFESMAGFSTTGSSALRPPLEQYAPSVMLWRSLIQWLGGMGIIVLSVALLAKLTHGGARLVAAEIPGPIKGRLRPKIAQTAKVLWGIYVLFSVVFFAVAVVLLALRHDMRGADLVYDAAVLTFSTISTGGFSTHTASIGFYDDAWLELLVVVFMLMGGVSFALYWQAFTMRDLRVLARDAETRFYFLLVLAATVFVAVDIRVLAGDLLHGLRLALFQAASLTSTTGYTTTNPNLWPDSSRFVLLLLMFTGGAAGSTSGALKVVRIVILLKLVRREVTKLLHPTAVSPIRLGSRVLGDDAVKSVSVFFFTYVSIVIFSMMAFTLMGLDLITAGSAAASGLGNIGPSFGAYATTYADMPAAGKLLMTGLMWVGRLELFTVLILFVPSTYKH